MIKKVGIITFHNSYNCGSMLQTYALQTYLEKHNIVSEIIDFSTEEQRKVYSVYCNDKGIKKIIKNTIFFFHRKTIVKNFESYEKFKYKYFKLSTNRFQKINELNDDNYYAVITGSDQVWNITIEDGNDAYFLPWVKNAKKIAYAPSFGSKNIINNAKNPTVYKNYIESFDCLSIREYNGQKWIKELTNLNVPVLIDPTLLLNKSDYEKIISTALSLPKEYIFFYSPGFNKKIVDFVKQIGRKYKLPIITFNTRNYFIKKIYTHTLKIPKLENPETYLQLVSNAKLIITTSFHGTIFSSIFRKKFWIIKNGGMYGEDDRVFTLLNQLEILDRWIEPIFKTDFDYFKKCNYTNYEIKLPLLRAKSENYFKKCFGEDFYED